MKAPSPTIATIASLGIPVSIAENGEDTITMVTKRTTTHIAITNLDILFIYDTSNYAF